MIKTVTLNPAVDKTVEISDFRVGAVNRVSSVRIDAGGKGINVSKIIKTLNGKSIALGIIAGNNGKYIKGYMDSLDIENDFVFAEGETRTNLKVVDNKLHTNTDINEPGIYVKGEEINSLENKIFNGMDKNTILVLSGSIPPGVPVDIYRRWIERAREAGARTMLDADGELLREGIKARPYLIKPNIYELEGLLKRSLNSVEAIVDAAESILDEGIEMVVVSMGADGAVFVNNDGAVHAEGIKVRAVSTVGAGDSMVAALAFALDNNYSFKEAVELSAGAGTAGVTTSGTQPPELESVLYYKKQVNLKYIK